MDILPLPEDMEEYEPGTMCTFAGWGNVGDGGLAPVVQKVRIIGSVTFL